MNTFAKITAGCVVAMSSAAMIGCDETVSKEETVHTNADGSKTKTMEETVKEADGTVKTEESKVVVPASQVND